MQCMGYVLYRALVPDWIGNTAHASMIYMQVKVINRHMVAAAALFFVQIDAWMLM